MNGVAASAARMFFDREESTPRRIEPAKLVGRKHPPHPRRAIHCLMSDDPKKRGPADWTRINPNEPDEVRYWSDVLGVTPERLKEAVKFVGPNVDAVRQVLGR
jgi:Protein of unknown function (DUF3606)